MSVRFLLLSPPQNSSATRITGAAFLQTSQDEALKAQSRLSGAGALARYKAANVEINHFWQMIFNLYSSSIPATEITALLAENEKFKKGQLPSYLLDYEMEKVFINRHDNRSIITPLEKKNYRELQKNLGTREEEVFADMGLPFQGKEAYVNYNPYRGFAPPPLSAAQQRQIDNGELFAITDKGKTVKTSYFFISKEVQDAAVKARNDDDVRVEKNRRRN